MDSKKKAAGVVIEKRETALDRLRVKNQAYCVRVADSINYIEATTPECFSRPSEKMLKTYAERLKEQRERMKMTLEEVGWQIGATRTAVEKIENSANQKINKTYLESFSLLFQVSPLYLLGKKKKSGEKSEKESKEESGEYIYHSPEQDCMLKSPFFEFEPEVVQKVQLILWKAYHENAGFCTLNQQLIYAFARLYFAKFDWLEKVKCQLFTIPAVEELLNAQIDVTSLYENLVQPNLSDFRDSHAGDQKFLCVQTNLCDLGTRDAELLNLLLYLILSRGEPKALVLHLLGTGGYLDNPKHFRQKDE